MSVWELVFFLVLPVETTLRRAALMEPCAEHTYKRVNGNSDVTQTSGGSCVTGSGSGSGSILVSN